jgi:hypothetical protein
MGSRGELIWLIHWMAPTSRSLGRGRFDARPSVCFRQDSEGPLPAMPTDPFGSKAHNKEPKKRYRPKKKYRESFLEFQVQTMGLKTVV